MPEVERIIKKRYKNRISNVLRILDGKKRREDEKWEKFEKDFKRAAVKYLRKYAKKRLDKLTKGRASFQIENYQSSSLNEKLNKFKKRWGKGGLIYLFQARDRNGKMHYLYIGRTKRKGGRLKQHSQILKYAKKKKLESPRVIIFKVENKKNLAEAECLGWHIYSPELNVVKPSKQERKPRCNVCKRIRKAIKYLRIRKKRKERRDE